MSDSEDSFHSASEGEDELFPAKPQPQQPDRSVTPPLERPPKPPTPPVLVAAAPKEPKKEVIEVIESDSSEEIVPEPPSPEPVKVDDGWEDFGDEADTEGDSEVGMEKVDSEEGEYFHPQAPKTLTMPSAHSEPKHGGLFDWATNVVSAVGEGLSNVVETGLGLPPPEEAARLSVAERRKLLEEAQQIKEPEPSLSSDEGGGVSPEGSIHGFPPHPGHSKAAGLGGLFGGFGSIVNGSLDVLESIGKKTFETLTVKDEEERRRRFILQPEKETKLSDILRELKQNEDAPASTPGKLLGYGSTTAKANGISFLHEFENNDGLVHLECFELLSKDYFAEKVAKKSFEKFDEQMAEFFLDDVSECPTEEFLKEIKKQSARFHVPYKPMPLTNANEECTAELTRRQTNVDGGEEIIVEEFYRAAVIALAKMTSKAIECLCRLVQQMLVSQTRPDLDSIFAFTYVVCRRLSFFASQYANLLSLVEQNSRVEESVTNIFFECSNACVYLKKALELARPFFPDDGFIFNPVAAPRQPERAEAKPAASTQQPENDWEGDDWAEW